MDGEQDLAHAHSAEPLDTATHLACGGQPLRAQGVVGLSERKKGSRKRLRREKEEIGTVGKQQLIYASLILKARKPREKPFLASANEGKRINCSSQMTFHTTRSLVRSSHCRV